MNHPYGFSIPKTTMNVKCTLFLALALLLGCKEEDITPIETSLNIGRLQQFNWENRSEVEEQAVDQIGIYKYAKKIVLNFNEIQFTHKTESYLLSKPEKMGDVNFIPALENSEVWGGYQVSTVDSTLVFHIQKKNHLWDRWNVPADSVAISSTYKILKLTDSKLELKPLSDMQIDGTNPIITFSAITK